MKLGMHLAGTSQPEESIAYFDEILDPSEPDPVRKKARINGMSKYRKNAVFGKAVALGRSKDNAKVDEKAVKAAGAAGVIRPSKNACQVIIGTKVQFVYDELKKML